MGGLGVFEDPVLAQRFEDLLREVMLRDECLVFAWVLLPNHFHIAVRQGPVPLSRSMKTLQQGVTRTRNKKDQVSGALWQGRFKTKEVAGPSYLQQLIAYIHLNPVKAGLVAKPDEYRYSGHGDIVRRRRNTIVSVHDVLLAFGENRRSAFARYRDALKETGGSEWSTAGPGNLPWWKLGRPPKEQKLQQTANAIIDEQGRSTGRYRRPRSAQDWLSFACSHLAVSPQELASRKRDTRIVQMWDALAVVGIERYKIKVKDLARLLGKSDDGVSIWGRRGAQRRLDDKNFAALVQSLDLAASEEP